jgi:hypothetical protein
MRLITRVSSVAALAALLIFAGANRCFADFALGDALHFAVLGQFSNNQTNFNNGTINGDVGIGSPRSFTASNATVNGSIRFSGASNTSGLSGGAIPGPGPYTVSGGGTVSGGVVVNDSLVMSDINYVNNLSHDLGLEPGTNTTISSGGSVGLGSGTVDGNNNRVFTVTSVSFPNGIFTINGSASDFVLFNVNVSTVNNPAFNGAIVLSGGITSDHVLFNMFGGNYTTHTGGPTLTISTNGATTTGIFLDPNGGMQINNSVLNGRFWGGDTTNQQIVSGADINAPPFPSVPEPSELVALLAMSLAGLGGMFFFRRRAKSY